MKRFIILVAVIVGVLAAVGGFRYLGKAANDTGERSSETSDPLLMTTAVLEKELEMELQARARGLVTDEDVDLAKVNLAKARHDRAMTEGK